MSLYIRFANIEFIFLYQTGKVLDVYIYSYIF